MWLRSMLGIAVSAGFLAAMLLEGGHTSVAQEDRLDSYPIYLPHVSKQQFQPQPFGVETISGQINRANVQERVSELGAGWVRINTISWREVQPAAETPVAEWNWDALAVFEAELLAANAAGMQVMVVVDDNPEWARVGEKRCSAIRSTHFGSFARFMRKLVERYQQPPYNVQYWEIGNEPDVDPKFAPADNPYVFGCWGDVDDPYYGGEHYGNMLKVVTPAIKSIDPDAQVIFGGLLLDTPNTTATGHGRPELFLEGVLRAGAADYFDILAYHSYPLYIFEYHDRTHDADRFDDRWFDLGGMTIGKARYLRELMQRYGVDKPLFLNETSLLLLNERFQPTEPDETYLQAQADQLVRLFARGKSIGIEAICWYTLDGPGWLSTALLDRNQQPRPSFRAFQHLMQRTSPSVETRNVTAEYGDPNRIEAYRFVGVSRETVHDVDVVWAYEPTMLTLPRALLRGAYTRDGAPLQPVHETSLDLQFLVGMEPVYFAMRPRAHSALPVASQARVSLPIAPTPSAAPVTPSLPPSPEVLTATAVITPTATPVSATPTLSPTPENLSLIPSLEALAATAVVTPTVTSTPGAPQRVRRIETRE